ncbi:MAG: 5-oxoprolinase subunit PxpA [Pseudoclavibacter sp.]|nr:5-oxoprolinase subunit PxpA [Pseudoclavibacter sp.]
MPAIDLNADLGENAPDRVVADDEAMLGIVTSANVSCGFHAGTPAGIRRTLAEAARRGVAIGAHPGYRDPEGFGRRPQDVPPERLQAETEYQLGALMGLATAVGARVRYLKPHGALYSAIHTDRRAAAAVAAAVRAIDDGLVLLCAPGSAALQAAARAGLAAAREAFADRAYRPDGSLVPRSQPGALLHEPRRIAERMLELVRHGTIEAIDGSRIRLPADSICVHGDDPRAVEIAAGVRRALRAAEVRLEPFAATG